MDITKIKKHFAFHGHDIFLLPCNEEAFLLYAPTLKKLLKISNKLALELSETDLSGEASNQDVQEALLLLKQALNNAIEPFPMHKRKANFFHLALGLTKNCTLNCLYCHADAGRRKDMSVDVLDNAIQYAFETAKTQGLQGVNISFAVGGEPTSNWELFLYCIERVNEAVRKHGMPVYTYMTTNGYYDEIKREYISKNIRNILLSLDGPPDVQNLHRSAYNGKESYTLASETAKYFIANAETFAIRSTVTAYSVKRLPEIVGFFFKEFGNRYDLAFEPVVLVGRAAMNSALVSEPSQNDYVEYYIKAKELGKKLGLEIRTSASNHKRLVTAFCGAMSIPSFTVTTEGIVTTCSRDSDGDNYSYGKFSLEDNKFVFNEQRISCNKNLIKLPAKCYDCFCKWHCAGDCPDVQNIAYDRCQIIKSLVQYELESVLSGANNKKRKEQYNE